MLPFPKSSLVEEELLFPSYPMPFSIQFLLLLLFLLLCQHFNKGSLFVAFTFLFLTFLLSLSLSPSYSLFWLSQKQNKTKQNKTKQNKTHTDRQNCKTLPLFSFPPRQPLFLSFFFLLLFSFQHTSFISLSLTSFL